MPTAPGSTEPIRYPRVPLVRAAAGLRPVLAYGGGAVSTFLVETSTAAGSPRHGDAGPEVQDHP